MHVADAEAIRHLIHQVIEWNRASRSLKKGGADGFQWTGLQKDVADGDRLLSMGVLPAKDQLAVGAAPDGESPILIGEVTDAVFEAMALGKACAEVAVTGVVSDDGHIGIPVFDVRGGILQAADEVDEGLGLNVFAILGEGVVPQTERHDAAHESAGGTEAVVQFCVVHCRMACKKKGPCVDMDLFWSLKLGYWPMMS